MATPHSLPTFLDPYLDRSHVTASRIDQATKLTIAKPGSLSIVLTIPDNLLEWSVSIVDESTAQKIASDWCDHYAIDGESEAQLRREMDEEIATLLDAIVDAPVRIASAPERRWPPWRRPATAHRLESRIGSEWQQIVPLYTGQPSTAQTSEFRPGFRLSPLDAAVLAAGTAGTIAAWRFSPEFAILGAAAVLHFFLFCNVFRVARRPELIWAAVFVACVAVRVTTGTSWLLLAGLVAATTVTVIWTETRKASYHGILWRRINPALPTWWSTHHRQAELHEPPAASPTIRS